MKKLIIRLLIVLVVLIVLLVAAVGFFLDGVIKRGVETVGSALTKVEIKLDSVSLSLLSGSGKIKGLVVGNPAGFKTPSAIKVGAASLSLQPGSILGDKVVIRSINVQGPEITFEQDLKGNNLKTILANLQAATGGENAPAQPKESKAGKKLEVDEFVITGGKIHLGLTALGGGTATVPLPEIRLPAMGLGPECITPAELTTKVLQAIEKEAAGSASQAVTDLGKGALGLTKGAGSAGSNAAEQVTKGLGGLFKKK